MLEALADSYRTKRKDIEEQAENFKSGLRQYCSVGLEAKPSPLKPEDIIESARALASAVDRVHGGFGRRGPKFPNPMDVALMLRGWRRRGQRRP